MNRTPVGWPRIVAYLTRVMGPEQAQSTLGDLLEDYRIDRGRMGVWRASWRAWLDARSIARVYAAGPGEESRGWSAAVDAVAHDWRAAVRAGLRHRGLTATVVLLLALSLAANTALFSIVDGLLFRPLPFRDADALVHLRMKPDAPARRQYATFVELIRAMEASPLLTSVSLASGSFTFDEDSTTEAEVQPALVSPGYFALLGLRVDLGRDLTAEDARQPHPHVVIDSGVWTRQFGEDISVLGRVSPLAGRPVVVVGVVRSGVSYPLGANVWIVTDTPISQSEGVRLWQLGRLAPGATVERLRAQFPDVDVSSLRDAIQPGDTRALLVLLAGTLLLLLTASVQVGSLLLARAVGRTHETAIKLALGISRARLARQHMFDAALPAILGVGLAWVAAPIVTHAVAAQLPTAMTAGQAIEPDTRTLAYTAAAGLLVIGLLAFTPWSLTRRMGRASRSGTVRDARVDAERWREALLVAQVACSSLLLCLAGLALHSFVRISRVDPGFDTTGLWQVSVPSLPTGLSAEDRPAALAARLAEAGTIQEALRALPTIAATGLGASAPTTAAARWVVYLAGRDAPLDLEPHLHMVTPDYLGAMRVRLIAGRLPRRDRTPAEPEELLVNRATARAWPADSDLMTAEIRIGTSGGRIVGVVEDLLGSPPGAEDEPRVFRSLGRSAPRHLLVRATTDDATVGAVIETVVSRTWARGRLSRVSRVSADLERLTAPWRARTILLGLIAGLCLPMVVAGLSGMLVSSVRLRWREIAVRLALGASRSAVSRAVLWRAWRLVLLGLLLGLSGGVAAGQTMSSLLYGVQALDIGTLAGVTAVTLLVTTIAALWPAHLASSIAPVEALRER